MSRVFARGAPRGGKLLLAPLICALLVAFNLPCPAQELQQEAQVRIGATIKKKIHKRLSMSVSPEVRTDGLNPDRYLLGLELRYKPIRYFAAEAVWRSDLEEKKRGLSYGHRPGASVSGYLPWKDFELGARVYYTYDFGHLRHSRNRLRYRLHLEYDVPHVRLDLEAHAEAFQQLETRGWFKMRYGLEGTYKFYNTKKLDQLVRLGYMLDYFLDVRRNVHIIELSYRLHF